MNTILNNLIAQRNGNYCHALELPSVEALEQTIEDFLEECSDEYTLEEYITFFTTASLYYYTDGEPESKADEQDLYSYPIADFVKEIYNNLF